MRVFLEPAGVRGKRGHVASGKTIIFGLLKRNDKLYTKIVPNCTRAALNTVIQGKIDFQSAIYSDGWKGYDGLVDLSYKRHHRVQHGNNGFANSKSHINRIENFWGIAEICLQAFRGLSKSTFYLHLKGREFSFNHRDENMCQLLLKIIKKPLTN